VTVPLPWERLLWSHRPLLAPWERYVLTDFRLVRIAGARSDEIALADIADVQQRRTWIDRLLRTCTIVVHARAWGRRPLVLAHIPRGAQLAALLLLTSADPQASWDRETVRAALAWDPRTRVAGYREAVLSVLSLVATVSIIAMGLQRLHGDTPLIIYPPDDAIAPGGVKKDRESIIRFMETDVMPWARVVLGPLKGGPDGISCETCHGRDAEQVHQWRMPAVVMLPQPDVIASGWERYGGGMDAQMRNAIYGYIAESDNQRRAAYMREVVMPGMARLLRRPAYDFTRSYDYNRSHYAFGCYHCHRVS
jgi:cytochrome c553